MAVSRRVLAAALATLVAAGGCTLPGQVSGPLELRAEFDDVGDLVAGHSVQVADVRVGSVTGIRLTDDFKAEVTMSIQDLAIPADVVARVRTTSLLGEKFIELVIPEGTDMANLAPEDRIADGAVIAETAEAPELEFVADQAVVLLGAVMGQDVATLVETGSTGFLGRQEDLDKILGDLAVISGTLSESSGDIGRIIDGLDSSLATLAGGRADVGTLLANLSETTTILVDNRDRALDLLGQLTRLAKVQNDTLLEPYADRVQTQIRQVDAILAEVVTASGELASLVDFLARFSEVLPLGVPRDRAQVYGWFSFGTEGSPDQ